MSYTQTDLDNVEDAILALATGQRVVEKTIRGKTTIFQRSSLDALRGLKTDIQVSLGQVDLRTYAKSRKGTG